MKRILVFALLWAIAVLLLAPSRVQSEPPSLPPPAPKPERNIKFFAEKYEVDYTLATAIARCESRLDPSVDNPHSSASGLYQFLDGTWEYYGLKKWGSLEGRDVYNYGDNAELAVWVISKYGTGDWNASRHCWG